MPTIKDRLRALELMRPPDDRMLGMISAAEYAASVLLGFIEDSNDPALAMVARGIDEAEALRFSRMGFFPAQRIVMRELHDEIESQ